MKPRQNEEMGSVLVVGDIHHDLAAADRLIQEHRSRASHVVILGDVFDTWGDGPATMQQSCLWLAERMTDDKWTFVAGNHDVSYLSRGNRLYFCPGWAPEKQRIFERICGDLARKKMRFAVNVGPWLLTHAGVTANLIGGRSVAPLVMAADEAWVGMLRGRSHPLLGCGRARGGADSVGGLTWCDWRREFTPSAGIRQICGHTPCPGVVRGRHLRRDGTVNVTETYCEDPLLRLGAHPSLTDEWTSINFCIDCDLSFAALITSAGYELLPASDWKRDHQSHRR